MKKTVDFFNLSFLDLLSGALGAVIFLFVIVPKGDGEGPAAEPQIYVSYDTIQKKFFGIIPDSLMDRQVGDTLLALVFDHKKAPVAQPVRQPEIKRPQPKPRKVTPPKEEAKPVATKSESKSTSPAQPKYVPPPKYQGSKPDVPCVMSIELKWENKKDNVDLWVCKGNQCVYGRKRQIDEIGAWDSGKARTKLFGADLRTNQESVRQFDQLIPGEYQILAQYKEGKEGASSIPVQLMVYTKNEQGDEHGKDHQLILNLDQEKTTRIAKAVIDENGTIDFETFK